jgi:hypothetical protein
MSDYRKHIEAAIQATVFHSATSYSWFGRRSHPLSPRISRVLSPTSARAYLLFGLQSRLYSDFYCRGFAAPAAHVIGGGSSGWLPFVDALSAANTGLGYWEDGWQISSMNGDIVVCKAGLAVRAKPQAYMVAPGDPLAPGTRLRLSFSKELRRMLPGFYLALSDQPLSQDVAQPLVRLYWNLAAKGAAGFVKRTTTLLNRAGLPFRLKVLNDPAQYTRCDAGVIYLLKQDYHAAREVFETIYDQVAASMKPATPVFTKLLAPGLGLAEDPGGLDSFGLHRCRILADGLMRAYEQGDTSAEGRWRVVAQHFAEHEVDLETPFLNPGSSDSYEFSNPQPKRFPALQASTTLAADHDTPGYLEIASDIGRRLAREAVWHADRCNWIGPEASTRLSGHGHARSTYRALGPELYDGSSGVALFLAQLSAITGDSELRRAALGGIRQALERAEAIGLHRRLGLYTGWAGVALAAARLSGLLGEEALIDPVRRLVERAADRDASAREFDLLAGRAGTIVGLIVLRDVVDAAFGLDIALQLADELLQAADRSSAGSAWAAPGLPANARLTGFSHGAAGIGYALLELFQATGVSTYRDAAMQAFQYERYWFDAGAGNWPDFRWAPAGKRGKRPHVFATHWCHGAPGIAVSRLRAFEITGDQTCKAEALVALDTTRGALEQALESGAGDFSLCHGLAGNAEVLRYGARVLGAARAQGEKLIAAVAQVGMERYATQPGAAWPGETEDQTPGLMLGRAGSGYFYLRSIDPAIPSILVPRYDTSYVVARPSIV